MCVDPIYCQLCYKIPGKFYLAIQCNDQGIVYEVEACEECVKEYELESIREIDHDSYEIGSMVPRS